MSSGPTPASMQMTVSYDVYGNILGGWCVGRLHTLHRIEINNELVWSGTLLRSASTNPAILSIPNRGAAEIYFGTADQTISASLAAIAATGGHIHPGYRDIIFIALKGFLLGRETWSAPNVRLSGLLEPVQSLITGAATELIDGQANPWVALAELFTHPLSGLGHPLALFDAPSWQACADACIPRAPEVYVSLRLTDRRNARAVAADLLTMCGGWVRPKRGTGRLEAGMWPDPATINVAALPVINSRLLTGEIEASPETWDDIKYQTAVTFKNRENLYKDDVAKYDDPRARRHSTNRSPLKLELPIVRPDQAATQARLNGRLRALPGAAYTAPFRGPALPDLQPGQHVRLDIDAVPGGEQLLQVCRVISVDRPFASRTHTVELEAERTLAPLAYTPAEEPGTPTDTEIPPITHLRLLELSPQAADGDDAAIALLAERPSPIVTELLAYYDSIESAGATYPLLSRARAYSLRGTLAAAIAADAATFTINLPGTLDRELASSPPGAVAARNDTLLLFIIGPLDTTGGIYNRPVEILSIADLSVPAANQLALTVTRARLGTAAMAAASGTEVWIAPRASLPWFRHADFEERIASGGLCYFKLQPATANRARPLDEIDPVSFRFNSIRAFAPVITTVSPEVDSGQTYTSVAIAERVFITGSVSDADANLETLDVVIVKDGVETSLLTRSFGGVASATYATEYTPTVSGLYEIIIRATDTTGRTIQKTQSLHVAISSASRCAEPTFEESFEEFYWDSGGDSTPFLWYVDYRTTIRCASAAINAGPSSTVKLQYARVPLGTAVESVTWTDAPVNENRVEFYGRIGYGSGIQSIENLAYRVWARAVDTTGTLATSFPVYVDFSH